MSRLGLSECLVWRRDLADLLAHTQEILASPLLRSVRVQRAGWMFQRQGGVTLGALLDAWSQGVFRVPCACGASACVCWASGSPHSGRYQILRHCPACGEEGSHGLGGGPGSTLLGFVKPMIAVQQRRQALELDETPSTLPLRLVLPVLRGEPAFTEGRDPEGNVVFRYDHLAAAVGVPGVPPLAESGDRGKWLFMRCSLSGASTWKTQNQEDWPWIYVAHDGSGVQFAFGDGVLHRPGAGDQLLLEDPIPRPALTPWIEEQLR